MGTDRHLKWLMTNRKPRDSASPIGRMVGELIEGTLRSDGKRRARLASLLARCVDEEFRRHCRMGELRGATLSIEVREPGLIGFVRARWAARIEQALRRAGDGCGVRRVLFVFGQDGDRLSFGEVD